MQNLSGRNLGATENDLHSKSDPNNVEIKTVNIWTGDTEEHAKSGSTEGFTRETRILHITR